MGITGLLDTARRALNTQSVGIRVIGDNIANVNTAGYTRRRAEIVSQITSGNGDLQVGGGSEIKKVIRIVDKFLNQDYVSKLGDKTKAQTSSEFLKRAESSFQLDGQAGKIGYELTEFFGSLEDLASNPGDIPLRTQVIQKGTNLAATINSTYNNLATLQREADDRIKIIVDDVNRITKSIAEVNAQLAQSERDNQEALTLRDQRDELLRSLGEKISFRTVDDSDGRTTVYLQNGFALVSGVNNYELSTTPSPSFAPSGGYPQGLDGKSLSHIVYDFGAGSQSDLTNSIRIGGGELAGLLEIRGVQAITDTTSFDTSGALVETAARVEHIARDLLTRFNLTYLGPDETPGGTYQPSSFGLNGTQPIPFGLFSFNGANSGNNFGDSDSDGRPENSDLNTIATSGIATNFASRLIFNVTNERSLASAIDLDPASASTTFAVGDSTILNNILAQRSTDITYSGLGNLTVTSSIEGMYSLAVSNIGGQSARSQDSLKIFTDRETQTRELQQSYSGVNLDEEFANLIKFQRAFEASSKLIKIGDELTSQIIQLLR